MNLFKIKYLLKNWKMIIHLLFYTKRFGVNNEWWNNFDSIWGWSWEKRIISIIMIKPIIRNYKMMKFRAGIGFVLKDTYQKIF